MKYTEELSNNLFGVPFSKLVDEVYQGIGFKSRGFYHEDYKTRIQHCKAISLKAITNLLSEDKAYREVDITSTFRSQYKVQRVVKTPDENTVVIDARTNDIRFAIILDFSSQYRVITEKELLQRKSRISKATTPYRLPKSKLIMHIARKFTTPTKKKYMGRRLIGFKGSKTVKEITWLYELGSFSTKELVKAILLALLEAIHFFITRVKRYVGKLKELTEKSRKFDMKTAYNTLIQLVIMYSLFLINYDEIKWRNKLREAIIILEKFNLDKLISLSLIHI